MEIILANYGVPLTNLESLAQTDSQAFKRAELVSFAKKWVQAMYPIHLALYLDILQAIKVLCLVMQQGNSIVTDAQFREENTKF